MPTTKTPTTPAERAARQAEARAARQQAEADAKAQRIADARTLIETEQAERQKTREDGREISRRLLRHKMRLHKLIRNMAAAGATQDVIADAMGISRQRLHVDYLKLSTLLEQGRKLDIGFAEAARLMGYTQEALREERRLQESRGKGLKVARSRTPVVDR